VRNNINQAESVKQRADLTFKHNVNQSRHGWLRLTPAYSVKLVDDILRNRSKRLNVFDPFSGTGTTALCAARNGRHAVSTDINPFLVWLGEAKLHHYSQEELRETKEKATAIQSAIDGAHARMSPPPPIANIGRWWQKENLEYLCAVKGEIDAQAYTFSRSKDLLLVAFCRLLIDLSNAAFNHQSMSFKSDMELSRQSRLWPVSKIDHNMFLRYVHSIVESVLPNPSGDGQVLMDDATTLGSLPESSFDILITSPPYPNRMSYIRELRPYMYWLGYLKEAREAGDLDWQAIGGTWGVATSRLSDWRRDPSTYFPEYLDDILLKISGSDGKSGGLLAKYVEKYFEDMWRHFVAVRPVMEDEAELHYIIGNSKFYDCIVPAERVFSDMLREAGFRNIKTRMLRKRNSKKELFEFDVVAEK
jgi:DNA modification methylase